MKFIDKSTIIINRELSELDYFTLDFIRILEKYTNYVLVSGYISILLGRSRASEDVDILVPKIDSIKLNSLYNELIDNGFICLNANDAKSISNYLNDEMAVRFSKKGTIIPNIEFKIIKNKFEEIALKNSIKVKLTEGILKISPLELQIAFKQEVLKSPKDFEDARHIEKIAEKYLDKKMIEGYKESLREFYK